MDIPPSPQQKKRKYTIGENTPYLKNIMDKDQYVSLLREIDPYLNVKDKWNIGYKSILDAMRQNYLTPDEVVFLLYLCETSVGRNVWFGDLYNNTALHQYKRTKRYDIVRTLKEQDIIRIQEPRDTYNLFRVDISPFYCWKGAETPGWYATGRWYSPYNR